MRLSFGLEQKLLQKQILAPRMIQSMEILQLPIMALQERIEQEMQENPTLEMQEQDPDLPERRRRNLCRAPRSAHRRGARTGDRRDDEQRARLRALDEDGRRVAGSLRGTLAPLAGPNGRRGGS